MKRLGLCLLFALAVRGQIAIFYDDLPRDLPLLKGLLS